MATTIRIGDLRLERRADVTEISARIDSRRMEWRGERLWVRMPADLAPVRPHGDPFVAGLLLPAMAAGADLVVDAPVSPSLAANLERLQALVLGWNGRNPYARLRRARLQLAQLEAVTAGPAKTGLFFSGGVDSLYSLVQAARDTRAPDALLFVHGFDVPLGDEARAALVVGHLEGVARLSGRRLVTMGCNLRRFTDPALSWDMAHGCGLAAAGHAIGGHFARLFISASDAHYRGDVAGTTTELDPLWSRAGLTFGTIGGEVDRQAKADALAHEPAAHRHLVVCWKAPPGMVNCGRCAKCLRTMLQFLVAGTLHKLETLPREVGPELISEEAMPGEPYRVVHWQAMLVRLSARPEWRVLEEPITALIERSRRARLSPRPHDLLTPEGRRLATAWLRRSAKQRMPVPLRRRLIAWRGGAS